MTQIRIYGDSILEQKAAPVAEIDGKIRKFADLLLRMMMEYDGLGLAANQIGKKLRMIALNVPKLANKDGTPPSMSPGEIYLIPMMPLVLVNPEIRSKSAFEAQRDEGCLSVPKIYAPVSRPASVVLKAQIIDGEMIDSLDCGGLLGRALQHEIDHLDGILFVNRLLPAEYEKIKPSLVKLKNKTRKSH